jgi:hypothetical protein
VLIAFSVDAFLLFNLSMFLPLLPVGLMLTGPIEII